MCEILVRAIDGTCTDPIANPRRGNLVVVQSDGHTWGRGECPPEFFIVKVPGLNATVVRPKTCIAENTGGVMLRRRRYKLSETMMTQIQNAGGILTVNSTTFNAAIIDTGTT